MRHINYPSSDFESLARFSRETPQAVRQSVAAILDDVRRRGDRALVELTQRFDGVRLRPSDLRISDVALRQARVSRELERAARDTLREVQAFARFSLPRDWQRVNGHGARVGEKFDPLQRVGIYVPGGSVPLVSTVFMTVVLARTAGVPEIAVCTPPPVAEALLWALRHCGASEVYQIGGAQAVAAMAYGAAGIPPVDKIFGPGNAYLTEAKRQLFGVVGVDLLAGPSELMVLADENARPDWAAADLLAQGEHGSGRERIFCVSPLRRVLIAIEANLRSQAAAFPVNKGLRQVLKVGAWFIHTRNRRRMADVANRLAPEHLQIMTRAPMQLASAIHTAGGIFIGNHTPTVVGDFVAGPSHTLPTMGSGRAFSGLRAADFMRRTSLVEYSRAALRRAASGVRSFARVEHLRAHELSLDVRQ
ncbi:MAG: histidinol dehydrogenase [Verrucomicrobia bacterium]|nr:histidinol dehydrogenase [Verrucomicrobiota bacterium]